VVDRQQVAQIDNTTINKLEANSKQMAEMENKIKSIGKQSNETT
jgi:hypothetical protein